MRLPPTTACAPKSPCCGDERCPRPASPRHGPAFVAAEPPAPARTLEQAEIDMIRATLDAVGGNISLASKQLGISRNTIYRKLRWNASAPD